jgi:hypothetical protein
MINPVYLYASDDPETVRSPGRLLTASISSTEPCRLYFDHVNGSPTRLRIVLVLRNATAGDASVTFVDGLGGPAYDFMAVGHAATKRFLINRDQDATSQRAVAGGGAVVLSDLILAPLECVCGVWELSTDSDAPLDLVVLALNIGDDPVALCTTIAACAPDRSNRKGKYDISQVADLALTYTVGSAQADFAIGDATYPNVIVDPLVPDPQPLKGEYAIVRHANVAIVNPTSSLARVALAVSPRGGSATGTYKINGHWLETPSAPAGAYYRLMTFPLAAGARGEIELITAAELNSSYPVVFRVALDRSNLASIPVSQC